MSIRTELIISLLLISVIPLFVVAHVSYDHSKNAIRESVMDDMLRATENTGHAIDNWMDARKDDISVISQSSEVVYIEKEQLPEYFNTFESEYRGVYNEFFILDLDGNIIFSTLNRTGNEGGERYFTEAAKGRQHTSDASLSGITGAPEILLSNPIKNNGSIIGVLAAKVSLENLYRIMENIDVGRSGEVFLVNKDGELIFHKNRSMVLLDSINNNFAVREVIYEKNGINEYVNYRGEKVLGSFCWLPLYRWGLIVEENRDEAYAGILALWRLMVGISSFAVLGVILLAVVTSRRFTKPIKSLEDGALSLIRGDFKPVPVLSRNEIGRMTDIFNYTAKELLAIREKLEAKIELANKDMEEKNKELTVANEKLKKLDKLKSDFISLVSHELKTPLSAIRISAEYLESERTINTDVQKELLQIIIRNIDRQTQLINYILDLSRIEAGKLELQLEDVNFHEIADVALENIGQLALKKQITVSVDIRGELPPVSADREKLIIVLNNLLGNALKFTPDGGNILLSAREYADSVEIRVTDTGIGIKQEDLKNIFEKFYQVDSTSRRKIGGSGIGLSISRGIIRAHGSDLSAESEYGKGSTFIFKLKKVGKI